MEEKKRKIKKGRVNECFFQYERQNPTIIIQQVRANMDIGLEG